MILAVGIDLVEVARIRAAMANPRFLARILTPRERRGRLDAERVAGRWAAKEAVAKAVGTRLGWHDVEIVNDASGAPSARIRPEACALAGRRLHLSVTHARETAAAVAVLERP